MDSHLSVSRKKPQGNAWTVADGLDDTWLVAAIAVAAVARTWTRRESGLSRWGRKLPVTHGEACAKPNHEQDHDGQFCDSSDQHAIDLNFDLDPNQGRSDQNFGRWLEICPFEND